jgi:hypothetical protein
MNDIDNINNIFFSAAMNREPWHLQILEGLGFTQGEIQQATAHYAANQALMRSSLRRPDSQEHVTLICTDRSMAQTIAQITGCAAIHKIDNVVKDKSPALITAERSLKYRLKKKELLVAQ